MEYTRTWHENLRHERELRGWTQQQVANALGTDEKRVSLWESGKSKPSYRYQRKLAKLYCKTREELGFIEEPGSEIADGIKASSIAQETVPVQATENETASNQSLKLLDHNGIPLITIQIHQQASTLTSTQQNEMPMLVDEQAPTNAYFEQGITLPPVATSQLGAPVDRRDFLLETGHVAMGLLGAELVDRFYRALKRPSTIDERTLSYFELRTEGYWQDRYSAALASHHLLSYVLEHLQKVITLLEGSLYPSVRTRLCCISSGIAQLAGHLLFDMSEFARARNFHQLAIAAAQEGDNQALEAVAWGRMSFTWTYSENLLEALRCIQEARHLAEGNVNTTVRAYLAAVEAEIQAILGNSESCLKALKVAECVEDRQYSKGEIYWLHFDRSRLAGYQGICFKRLYHPGDARTHSFVNEAQKALTDALALLDPARIQRRPTFLIDIAGTYAQQGNVEGACGHAIQALSIMAQTKSQTAAKRLLTFRQELDPWKDTQYVKDLDVQIASLITLSRYRGIA